MESENREDPDEEPSLRFENFPSSLSNFTTVEEIENLAKKNIELNSSNKSRGDFLCDFGLIKTFKLFLENIFFNQKWKGRLTRSNNVKETIIEYFQNVFPIKTKLEKRIKFIITGNIGSGKSTLLNALDLHHGYAAPDATAIPIISLPYMYENFNSVDSQFSYQLFIYASNIYLMTRHTSFYSCIFYERNNSEHEIWSNFKKLTTDQKDFFKFLYEIEKKFFATYYDANILCYLNTSPSDCFENIKKIKDEGEEKLTLTDLQYLDSLYHDYYEKESKRESQKTIIGDALRIFNLIDFIIINVVAKRIKE